MARKGLIAIIIIIIVVVGGVAWYLLYGQPVETQGTVKMLYVDGGPYNTTQITWTVPAEPNFSNFSLHNVNNPTNNTETVFFNYTVSFFNATLSDWQLIYDGAEWLIPVENSNITASLVFASGTLTPMQLQPSNKPFGDKATYHVYMNFTDQVLNMKFEYTGDQPTVDGHTVFTFVGFDGNGNGVLDASERAFNFTNNPDRSSVNMLQEYAPLNNTAWNTTAAINTYEWNGNSSPSEVPVSVGITDDRKNVTWTIPFTAIGATEDSFIGVVMQAFGYDFYPSGASTVTPSNPSNYKLLDCRFPNPAVPFTFAVLPQSTVKFFLRVRFLANAIPETQYRFTYNAII